MADFRVFRLSHEQSARSVDDELRHHGYAAELSHGDTGWVVVVGTRPEHEGDLERLLRRIDPNAAEVRSTIAEALRRDES